MTKRWSIVARARDAVTGASRRARRNACLSGITAALAVSSPLANAARPFVVDDARVVERGACQIETWRRNNRDSHEYWALPACNPFGVELTAGGGYQSSKSPVPDLTDYQFQGKWLGRELTENGWGWGFAAGLVRHADINLRQNLIGSRYFYFPVSVSFRDDRVVLLTNLGGVDNRDEGRRGVLWGIGGEFYLTPRVMLAAETYGATGLGSYAQFGGRLWIVPDHLQLDASYGGNLDAFQRTHWTSFGLRFITKPFF